MQGGLCGVLFPAAPSPLRSELNAAGVRCHEAAEAAQARILQPLADQAPHCFVCDCARKKILRRWM